jgi:phenylacetate-CoA ligase
LKHRFDKSYYRVWTPWFLEENQWNDQDTIRELQLEGLKALLQHARTHTSFYKGYPEITELDDLETIPILTKQIIHDNYDRLLVKTVPGTVVTSSGTVSVSTIMRDNRLSDKWGAERFQNWHSAPNYKQCFLWGAIYTTEKPVLYGGKLYLPVDSLNTREDALNYLKMINDFKPGRLRAYVSGARFLAHFALEEGITPEVGVIETTAEMLHPEARNLIEEAFQCPVFNFYSSEECSALAQDCGEHDELHINAERYIVEEVDGNLLITDLLNYSMPLVRYDIQDLGQLSNRSCPCGRGLPLIKNIEGRVIDFLYTKSGKWVPSLSPRDADIGDIRWVSKYQWIQAEQGKVTLRIQPWPDMEVPRMEEIERAIKMRWPEDELEVKPEIVDSMIMTKSGKQIFVVTDLRPWEMN